MTASPLPLPTPPATADTADGTLAIEAHFRGRMFRGLLIVVLVVHILQVVFGEPGLTPAAALVLLLALAIGAAVEFGPPALWQGLAASPHQIGIGLIGVLYTLYLGTLVGQAGGAAGAASTWWMLVFPVYVILAGALHAGLVLLGCALAWLVAVHGAAALGWMAPAGTSPSPLHGMLAAVGSSLLVGAFMALSVRRRVALQGTLLQVIARLAREREEALAQANAKAMLLTTLSQEVRTPLNGVIGMAELLGSPDLAPAQRRQVLGLMRQSADTLGQMTDDVGDYARAESERAERDHVPFVLRPTLQAIADLFAPQAHGKGLEIGVSFIGDLPHRVEGDPTRLRQILANFVSNAVRVTSQGGVQICVECLPDGWLRFEVHDSGSGLPQATLDALLAPEDGHDTPTVPHAGKGLGLRVSRRLAERLGGRVSGRSTPGQGTVFRLELPLPAAPGNVTLGELALPPLAGVVLVADNLFLHWTVADMLTPRGIALQRIGDLDDPRLDTLPPRTVVLIDSRVLADARAARRLGELTRQLHKLGTLPVLLQSMASAEAPATLTGGSVTLYKPVWLSRLLTALTQALETPITEPAPAPLPPAAEPTFTLLTHPAPAAGPAAQPAAPRETPPPAARTPPPSLDGLRVLLADDNAINQVVSGNMLRELGANVTVAESGSHALDQLEQQPFDLVLLDCEMPDIDGFEVARRWRAIEARDGRPRTPIVAVTGHNRRSTWPRCRAAGMDDFLSKPFFPEHVAALVRTWVPSASMGLPSA